jgi:hypothetical protein
MKKLICLLISAIMILSCTVISVSADAAIYDVMLAANTCPNNTHQWEFEGYSAAQNQHTLRCRVCQAYMVESCYNYSFCGYYPDVETLKCEGCNYSDIYIHNYSYQHQVWGDDFTHILQCTNYSDIDVCYSTKGSEESCALEAVQIWRGWHSRGHYLTQTCSVCEYQYTIGYFYPVGHSSGTDPDCSYCQMGEPYHQDY